MEVKARAGKPVWITGIMNLTLTDQFLYSQ